MRAVTYATGEWSLTALTDSLDERGLTTVPTKKLAEKPLDDQTRRQLNQAVFERFLVDEAGSEAEPTGVFGILLQPDLLVEKHAKTAPTQTKQLALARHRGADWRDGVPTQLYASRTWRRIAGKKKPPELICSRGSARTRRASFLGLGLNKSFMAERAGFEPAMEVEPHTRLAGECLQPLGHLSRRSSQQCKAWDRPTGALGIGQCRTHARARRRSIWSRPH